MYACPLDTCPENKGVEEEKEDSQTASGGGYDGEGTLLHRLEYNLEYSYSVYQYQFTYHLWRV